MSLRTAMPGWRATLIIQGVIVALVLAGLARKAAAQGPVAPPRRDDPGLRLEIAEKQQVYVPDFFSADALTSTPLVVFFHGAAWCAEQTFYDGRQNAVLVSVQKTASSDWDVWEIEFPGLISRVQKVLSENGVTSAPVGSVCLASFSGGYAAIRAILRRHADDPLITDVVLADSLYAPRLEGRPDDLDPSAMEPFVQYARRAAAGRGRMIFSHLYPPLEEHRGNTTTLTAKWLMKETGAVARPATGTNSRRAVLLYKAEKAGLTILGYSGMTTQDHFEHFYSMGDLYRRSSLPPAP